MRHMDISTVGYNRYLLKTLLARQRNSFRKMRDQGRFASGENNAGRVRSQNAEQSVQKRQRQSKTRTSRNRIGTAGTRTRTKLCQVQFYRCRIDRFSAKIGLQFLLIGRYLRRSKDL